MKKLASLVAVVLLGLYGCGGGDDDSDDGAAGTTEATEDTTDDTAPEDTEPDEETAAECPVELTDVEAAFPDVDFAEQTSDDEASCTFPNAEGTGSVNLSLVSEDGKAAYEQTTSVYASQGEELEDVGDEAMWIQGNTSMHALEGDTYVAIQLVSLITDVSEGTEKVFAELRQGAIDLAKAALEAA